jgi:Tfp pilus assembly protein PilN
MKPLHLNLATRPRRNRRFFLSLAGLLGLALAAVLAAAVFLFLHFTLKSRAVKAELREAEGLVRAAETEQRRLAARIRESAKKDQQTVDVINSIILRKSFSWTEFLSTLETVLPPPCYILSLNPTQVEDTRIQVRFKVASPSLNDLLSLITKLNEMKFSQIRVENEERNTLGQVISEISVTYERVV